MTRNLRHAGLVTLIAVSTLGSSVSASRLSGVNRNDEPYVAISSLLGRLPNIDPLVDPYSFFLVRPWELTVPMTNTVVQRGGETTLDLPLDIQAMNFSGTIFLRVSCQNCRGIPFDSDVIPNQIAIGPTVPVAPGAAVARFADALLASGGEGGSMRIPTASVVARFSTRSTQPDAGSFLFVVEACSRRGCDIGSSLGKGYIVVSQVVIPSDGSGADCPNVVSPGWRQGDADPPGYQRPDDLPLQQFLRGLFIEKRASPQKRVFRAGVHAPVRNAGWNMRIEKAVSTQGAPLDPTESVVRLENPTRNLTSLVALGSGCRIIGNLVLNPGDSPQELRISQADTTTIVLSGDGEALGRFSDANFWTLFGGRKVTLSPVR